MKEIFAKRLKSARTLAGLSQDELVQRMGDVVTKNAISKYEKGEMMADGAVLLALSKALGISTDYFFRPFTIGIENIELSERKADANGADQHDNNNREIRSDVFVSSFTIVCVIPILPASMANFPGIDSQIL